MKTFKKILFYVGILLLAINVYGLFKSLRNPAIYDEEKTLHNRLGDITIKYPDIEKDFARHANESEKDFAIRMNTVVNKGMCHYWKDDGVAKYNLRVPVYENYLLYAAAYIDPKEYSKYEFSDYKKDLERGLVCAQRIRLYSKAFSIKTGLMQVFGILQGMWFCAQR